MAKSTTSVRIDTDIFEAAKRAGMNISGVLEDALRTHLDIKLYRYKGEDLVKQKQQAETQLAMLDTKLKAVEKIEHTHDTKQRAIKEFDTMVGTDIIHKPSGLMYWEQKTGLSVDELIERKRGKP